MEYLLFTFSGTSDLSDIHSQALSDNFILPIEGNIANYWGMNWTNAYEQINNVSVYNCTYEGDILIINGTKLNVIDSSTNLLCNITLLIKWNSISGSLDSVEINKIVEDNLFHVKSTISSKEDYQETKNIPQILLELSDPFLIFGIIASIAAVIVSTIILLKIRKK